MIYGLLTLESMFEIHKQRKMGSSYSYNDLRCSAELLSQIIAKSTFMSATRRLTYTLAELQIRMDLFRNSKGKQHPDNVCSQREWQNSAIFKINQEITVDVMITLQIISTMKQS